MSKRQTSIKSNNNKSLTSNNINKNNNNLNISQKLNKLSQTLHKAEIKQLNDFIKSRSNTLDNEITNLKIKLNIKDSDLRKNDVLSNLSLSSDQIKLAINGNGINNSINENITNNIMNRPNALQSTNDTIDNPQNIQDFHRNNDHNDLLQLKVLFQKMKISMEENNVSPSELRQLLLPSELLVSPRYNNTETEDNFLPVNEYIDVMQTDLSLSISIDDEHALLRRYGNSSREVNIRSLLTDAGLWLEHEIQSPIRENVRHSINNHIQNNYSKFDSNLIDKTMKNVDILDDMHDFITNDNFDELTLISTNSPEINSKSPFAELNQYNSFNSKSVLNPIKEEMNETLDNIINIHHDDLVYSPDKFKQEDNNIKLQSNIQLNDRRNGSSIGAENDNNEYEKLINENKKLKKELKSFDNEFFEQLEDLKYRYNKLQEVNYLSPNKNEVFSGSTDRFIDRSLSPPKLTYTTDRGIDSLKWSDHKKFSSTSVMNNSNIQLVKSNNQINLLTTNIADSFNDSTLYHHTNVYERKLVYELINDVNSNHIINTLFHKVIHVSKLNKLTKKVDNDIEKDSHESPSYIHVNQLIDIIHGLGFNHISASDITNLAKGFASDGKGGILVYEFIETIKSIIYSIKKQNELHEKIENEKLLELEKIQHEEKELKDLLVKICDSIFLHDKKAILSMSSSIYNSLIQPFIDFDIDNNNYIDYDSFIYIINNYFHILLNNDEYYKLAIRYQYLDIKNGSKISNKTSNITNGHDSSVKSNIDESFDRRNVLINSIKGASIKNKTLDSWLSNNKLTSSLSSKYNQIIVNYKLFIDDLAEVYMELLNIKQGISIYPYQINSNVSEYNSNHTIRLLITNFTIIDILISQLEDMSNNNRRKCLTNLLYQLSNHDKQNNGSIDGFTMIQSLVNVGFRLQRIHRIQLLKSIEEIGGMISYVELVKIFYSLIIDWKNDEKIIIKKILNAMGLTISDRRSWLTKLRNHLSLASNQLQSDMINKNYQYIKQSLSSSTISELSNEIAGVPPAVFLHCLKECNVSLTIEEEAILLDCLDIEHKAIVTLTTNSLNEKSKKLDSVTGGYITIPLIYYESLLNYIDKHCGHWSMSLPDNIKYTLDSIINESKNSIDLYNELELLFKSFDNNSHNYISKHSFFIISKRSSILSVINDKDINILCELLLNDGNGKIYYNNFLLYIYTSISTSKPISSNSNTTNQQSNDIINQLLTNAIDNKNTFLPLRNYLLKNYNKKLKKINNLTTVYLSNDEIIKLLNYFQIFYTKIDFMNFVKLLEVKSISTNQSISSNDILGGDSDNLCDISKLFKLLFKHRDTWINIHSTICDRIKLLLSKVSRNDNDIPNLSTTNSSKSKFKSSEYTFAKKIINRLKAFSYLYNNTEDRTVDINKSAKSDKSFDNTTDRMIDKDIFFTICNSMGLTLTEDEIIILSDSSDISINPSSIRCNMIIEALNYTNNQITSYSNSQLFALQHVKQLVWKTGQSLNRSNDDWIKDIIVIFNGFDSNNNHFISFDDLLLIFELLHINVSIDILNQLPGFIDNNFSTINYVPLLNYITQPLGDKTGNHSNDMNISNSLDNNKQKDKLLTNEINTKSDIRTYQSNNLLKLVHSVRKKLNQFITSIDNYEEAWYQLVKIFQLYDPINKYLVTPREFCICISTLLDNNDSIVLTEEEWVDIIKLFIDNKSNNMVNYMKFCDIVMDKNDMKAFIISNSDLKNRPNYSSNDSSRLNINSSKGERKTTSSNNRNIKDIRTTGQKSRESLNNKTNSAFSGQNKLKYTNINFQTT